jgi:GNAT superfamily N-acetyltransferase
VLLRDPPSVHIRARAERDLDGCAALAAAVKRRDGYPPHLPTDLRQFVAGIDVVEAWVAEVDGEVVGHVGLHRTTSEEVIEMACRELGVEPAALGVVARLFVAPARRGEGVGGQLLAAAASAATVRGLRPILDVGTMFTPAIALYEKHGWTRIGQVTVPFRDLDLHEFVYVGPA